MEKKTAERLKQDFENKFDCYADTDNGLPIMAMTFDAVKAIVEQYAAQETAGMYTKEQCIKMMADFHNNQSQGIIKPFNHYLKPQP